MECKYKVKGEQSIDDLMWQEDREYENELMQQQARYYSTCADINIILLQSLRTMDNEEIKEILKNNLRIPVIKIN